VEYPCDADSPRSAAGMRLLTRATSYRGHSVTNFPPYDPTLYKGSASYYLLGRPPYSSALRETIAAECGLDGTGRLLDVGCGPGVLAVELAPLVSEVVGLDPDTDMLDEANRHAGKSGVTNVRWVHGLAEQIPELGLGSFKLVTFGQSFHRTDREKVAEAVYDLLEPGGSIALVAHTVEGRPEPFGPVFPRIPNDEILSLIDSYLGPRRRSGQSYAAPPTDRWEAALSRTSFGQSREVFAPGRPDIVQDVDGVLANYLSMSYAAPHLFGDRREDFVRDGRQLLSDRSPSGLFWDWPGDTAVVVGTKPG
jgi:SAM-dependent methyltransferase